MHRKVFFLWRNVSGTTIFLDNSIDKTQSGQLPPSYFWSDSEVSQKHPYESRDPKDERRRES